MTALRNKRVLVTGSCGTVGTELVRQLLCDPRHEPAEVIGIDNNESALFFQDQLWLDDSRARFLLADVRDGQRLDLAAEGVDVVFHTAALKHVVMCERSPMDAVQTNILGVENVIAAARRAGAERVIFTSSDKAVNPTNVMGTSKLMGERLITAANSTKRGDGTIFASTRFGNVLGSSGSVMAIFRQQIARGGPVTLTDAGMTRFVMSIEQAVRLVIDSGAMARGGEVFITKMPVIRIADLARVMIDRLAPASGHDPARIEIVEIGAKPGEKHYEELMSQEETRRAMELADYFAIPPAFRGLYQSIDYAYEGETPKPVTQAYSSEHQAVLSTAEIAALLDRFNLFDPPDENAEPADRYWPGDKEELTS